MNKLPNNPQNNESDRSITRSEFREHIDTLVKVVATKDDLTYLRDSLVSEFNDHITDFKSETFKRLDAVLKEVKTTREEVVIIGHRVDTHDKRQNRVENELRLEPLSDSI